MLIIRETLWHTGHPQLPPLTLQIVVTGDYETWAEGEHVGAASVTQKLEQFTWMRVLCPVPCSQDYICFYSISFV